MRRGLRVLAVVGVIAWLIHGLAHLFPMEPRQWVMALPVLLIALGTLLVFRYLLPEERRLIVDHPDLLVPLAVRELIFLCMIYPILYLPFLGWVDAPFYVFTVIRFTTSVSVFLIAMIAAWVAYAAWVTPLLWQALRESRVDLADRFREIPRRFPSALAAESIGVVGMVLVVLPAMAAAELSPLLSLALLLVLSVVWNLVTVQLVPVALSGPPGRGPGIRGAFRIGIARWRSWAVPVLAQLVLLGAVTVLYVSYTETAGRTTTSRSTWDWGVHAEWIGGYDADTDWDGELAKALDTSEVVLASFLLTFVLSVLSLGVKLRVMRRIAEDGRRPRALNSPGACAPI